MPRFLSSQGTTIVAICLMASLNLRCSTAPPSNNEETPPDIPPASTFVMNFDDFGSPDDAKTIAVTVAPTREGELATNWGWAATHIAVWNVALTVTLVVPVAAFVESFNHTPQWQPDRSWIWAYDVTVPGGLYSAELHARAVGDDIEWDMFISKEGEFTNVHWFSGVSNKAGTVGTWTVNTDPQQVTPFLDIDWERDPTAETARITYTNIVPDGAQNGGYISYGVTETGPLDAFYDIFNAGADNLIEIEWSRDGKEGHVKDADHFGDENWRCWDSALLNTDCGDSAVD